MSPALPALSEDLIDVLNSKLRLARKEDELVERTVVDILLNGSRLVVTHPLSQVHLDATSDSPRLVATTRTWPLLYNAMKLTVDKLSNMIFEVECADTDTVGHLKERIYREDGMPVEMQRLCFAPPKGGRPFLLADGSQPLTALGIQDGSKLVLTFEMGRRSRFMGWKIIDAADKIITIRNSADYSEDDPFDEGLTIVTVPESYAIPLWRECVKGFSFEGTCKNVSCASFDKSVIRWCASGTFSPFRDFECPTCKGTVTPTGCGFYDCQWKLEGVKKSDGSYFSTPWKEARGEKFRRFQRDELFKPDEWQEVSVAVWPIAYAFNDKRGEDKDIETTDDTCGICWSKMAPLPRENTTTTACGHSRYTRRVQSSGASGAQQMGLADVAQSVAKICE